MAYEVIWSPQAIGDLDQIVAYLDGRSDTASTTVVEAIRSAIDFPNAGRIVPEFNDPARRETFAFAYRIIYRVEVDCISVLRIEHGRRLFKNVSGSFQELPQAEYIAS